MAEGLALVLVQAALRRSQNEASVLDCARPDENVPVRLPGLPGEGRRYGKEGRPGLRERAVERRKAQVVTDRQAETPPRQVRGDCDFAGPEGTRLPIALAVREIDIEHVNLGVARDDLAVAIDEEGPVTGTVRRNLDGQGADMDIDAELARKFAKASERGVFLLGHNGVEQALAPDIHHVGHFRRLRVIRAGTRSLLDERRGGVEISGRGNARAHRNEGCPKGCCRAHAGALNSVAAGRMPSAWKSESRLPARSSAQSSSAPPTWVWPTKICGTV